MFIKKYKNKNLIRVLFFILLCFFIFSPFIIASAFLPQTIHLIEGKEEVFDLRLPVRASFGSENASAFKINEVYEEDKINLGDKFTVVSDKAGDSEITLTAFGLVPVKKITVATLPDCDVVPSGAAVGVRINTDGVMVLGTGELNKDSEPSKNILRAGDLILSANGEEIENKEQLTKIIEDSEGREVSLEVKRNSEELSIAIQPVKSTEDNKYKLGIWVRDSTQGIGTITYYNPESLKFGALGHGIMDVDTKRIMSIKDGSIMPSSITSAKKGKKGSPGELFGNIERSETLGQIKNNSAFGIYGYLEEEDLAALGDERMKVGLQNEVSLGKAEIISTIEGDKPKKYSVEIESINKYSNDNSKGMIVKITDNELLEKTNGIVQGMSGSPIIQNNKLIGAVTHVFVQDPTKGYGIFIENMLNQEESF